MIYKFINRDLFGIINEYTDLRNFCDTCRSFSILKFCYKILYT